MESIADKDIVVPPTDPVAQATAADVKPEAEVSTEPPAEASTEPLEEKPPEEAAPQAEEPAPAEAEESVLADLDDETIEALVEVYGDKLLTSRKLQQQVNRTIQEQVAQQINERTRTLETQGEVASLIQRGQQAVRGLTGLAEAAKGELTKAQKGEDFDTAVFEPQAFLGHLSDYGQAIVAEVSGRYDRAIQGSIELSLTRRLPELTEEQAQEFYQITQIAQRMEGDPNQRANAKAYFVDTVVGFLMQRALEAGALWERDRVVKRSEAVKKIAETNAIKAAAAKIAKDRAPPPTPTSLPQMTEPGGAFSRDYYRELKAKDPREAQEYVNRYAAMQRVPTI